MKKIIAMIFLLALTASLISCGGKSDNRPVDNAGNQEATSTGTDFGEAENNETAAPSDAGQLDFSTTDIDGNPYTPDDIKDAKVVMVNFWEPWCGPCVGEIGDLAKLYEEYKDRGFLILGVYSTEGQDEDVRSIITDNGVTYPVIKSGGNMSEFMTAYVPTTVFADGSGRIISAEPEIGAHSYDEWKAIIEDYLAKA